MLPVRRGSLTNEQSAGEGGKRHRNARHRYPDTGTCGGRSVMVFDMAQIAIGGNQIAPAPASGAMARQAFEIDFRRFVSCCCHTANSPLKPAVPRGLKPGFLRSLVRHG